jgi:hypothetical protein
MPQSPNLRWTSVKDALPPQDEEVIILTDDVNGTSIPGANRIAFGHIVDKTYAKDFDGWNIPGVHHWMPCPGLPEDSSEPLCQDPLDEAEFDARIIRFWNDNVLDMRLGRITMLDMVLRAAKLGASLQQEADEEAPCDEDLEKAIKEFIGGGGALARMAHYTYDYVADAVRFGAQWQKQADLRHKNKK